MLYNCICKDKSYTAYRTLLASRCPYSHQTRGEWGQAYFVRKKSNNTNMKFFHDGEW